VKGTWREGSLAGVPAGQVEKALKRGIYFHRGPTEELASRHLYRGL
jgi:hypothetical protein